MSAPQPDATVSHHDKEKVALEGQGNGSDDAESIDSFTNPTGINEKALLRRLDWKLLPPLTLLYLLSFLDRSNSMYPASLLYEKEKGLPPRQWPPEGQRSVNPLLLELGGRGTLKSGADMWFF
jgi:hypothetical protein